jgi:hypothetical protein
MECESWKVVGASVKGTSHELDGRPCQDAHSREVALMNAVHRDADGGTADVSLSILVVADGAGSARFSEEGARVAADFVASDTRRKLESLDAKMWPEAAEHILRGTLCSAHIALAEMASLRGAAIEDFACTMIVVVLATDGIVGIHIGDGAVVASVAPGHVKCATVSPPQKSEYFNEVSFLTSSEFEREARFFVRGRETGPTFAVAVLSDGLELLALNTANGEAHTPFFRPLFSFVERSDDLGVAQEQIAAFLAGQRVCDRTDDDKTLVLAVAADEAPTVEAGA